MKKLLMLTLLSTISCRFVDNARVKDISSLKAEAPSISILGDELPLGEQNILLVVGRPISSVTADPFDDMTYFTEFKRGIVEKFAETKSFYAAVYVDTKHFKGLPKIGAKASIRKGARSETEAAYSEHAAQFPEGETVIKTHLPIVHDPSGSMTTVLGLKPKIGDAEYVILKKDGSIIKLPPRSQDGHNDAVKFVGILLELNRGADGSTETAAQ